MVTREGDGKAPMGVPQVRKSEKSWIQTLWRQLYLQTGRMQNRTDPLKTYLANRFLKRNPREELSGGW